MNSKINSNNNPLNFTKFPIKSDNFWYGFIEAKEKFDMEKFYNNNPQFIYPSLENISKLPMYGKSID